MTSVISDFSPGPCRKTAPQARYARDLAMCGREPERRIVRDLLRRAQQGVGGVVLVEGEPGIGTSLLLREAVGEAAGLGFSLAAGAADRLGRALPFFALHAALGEPLARFTASDPGVTCLMRRGGGSARWPRIWNSGPQQLQSWCAWMTCSGQARPPWQPCGRCHRT